MRFSLGGGRNITVHLDHRDNVNANVGGFNKAHCSLEFYEPNGGDQFAVFATQDQLIALANLILGNAGVSKELMT